MKIIVALIVTVFLCAGGVPAQKSGISYSTEDELKTQVAAAPCKKNKDSMLAVKELFIKSGATEEDIRIEEIDNVENLIVTKKGASAETVVVGAHYDKTIDGCGAVDNWTGIVIMANLYRT